MRIMGVVSWLNGPASLDESRPTTRPSLFQLFVAFTIAALFEVMAMVCVGIFLVTFLGLRDGCFRLGQCDQSLLDRYPFLMLVAGVLLFITGYAVAYFVAHTRWVLLFPLFAPPVLAIGLVAASYT